VIVSGEDRAEWMQAAAWPACRRPKQSVARGDEKNSTILVVDDDPTTRLLLAEIAAYEGYRTLQASTGEQALAKVRDYAADVVLLDLALPTLSGLDVLRVLKLGGQGCNPRVIVVSAYSDLMREADAQLADGRVAKPFDVDDLLGQIERVRSRSRARQSE
jgi:DNA-binding response OmpR family regulator